MTDQKPGLSLKEAQTYLAKSLGSVPDKEMLLEWIRLGYLSAEGNDENITISELSLNNLVEQLEKVENKRGARLVLHAVDIWRREPARRAVAITLSTKTNVVTTEQLCKDDEEALLEAAVRATLDAISEVILPPLYLKFRQVKHHSMSNIEQSIVAVLITTGEGDEAMILSGVAMTAKSSSIVEAAARATLNALNRTLTPFLIEERSWRDILKGLLPSV
jgi:hypothetical protein